MSVSRFADAGTVPLTVDPDDDMRATVPSGSGMRFWAALAVAGIAIAGFAGVVGYGYLAYSGRDAEGPMPIVRSDPRPDKVKPEDPGGHKIPHQGISVFDLGQRSASATPPSPPSQQARGMERLLPPPEPVLPKPMPAPPPVASVQPIPAVPIQSAASPTPSPQQPAPSIPSVNPPMIVSTPGPLPPPPRPGSIAATRPAVNPTGPATISPAFLSTPDARATAASPVSSTPVTTSAARSAPAAGSVRLQVAALRTDEEARQAWSRLQRKHADVLGALTPTITRVDLANRGSFFRVQAGPWRDRGAAEDACARLKRAGTECMIVPAT